MHSREVAREPQHNSSEGKESTIIHSLFMNVMCRIADTMVTPSRQDLCGPWKGTDKNGQRDALHGSETAYTPGTSRMGPGER